MLCNGVELYKYNHPHSLNELSAGDKLINEYVECKIDRYIVTPVSEYLTDQYTGQSELYFDFFNTFNNTKIKVKTHIAILYNVAEICTAFQAPRLHS